MSGSYNFITDERTSVTFKEILESLNATELFILYQLYKNKTYANIKAEWKKHKSTKISFVQNNKEKIINEIDEHITFDLMKYLCVSMKHMNPNLIYNDSTKWIRMLEIIPVLPRTVMMTKFLTIAKISFDFRLISSFFLDYLYELILNLYKEGTYPNLGIWIGDIKYDDKYFENKQDLYVFEYTQALVRNLLASIVKKDKCALFFEDISFSVDMFYKISESKATSFDKRFGQILFYIYFTSYKKIDHGYIRTFNEGCVLNG